MFPDYDSIDKRTLIFQRFSLIFKHTVNITASAVASDAPAKMRDISEIRAI